MKRKHILVMLLIWIGLLSVCLALFIVPLLGNVHAEDITLEDQKRLQEYCLQEFLTPRFVMLGHGGGGHGTLSVCLDRQYRDSEELAFKNIEFISKTYEGKDYEGNVEVTLYFKIDGYCAAEQKNRTFYSFVTLTNPRRVFKDLKWDEIKIDAIIKVTEDSYMYRFADAP